MEDLIKEQLERQRRIGNSYSNFKKEGQLKMTLEANQVRYTNLNSIWQEFRATHKEIVAHEDNDFQDDYFTQEVFAAAENTYLSNVAEFMTHLKTVQPPDTAAPTPATPATTSNITTQPAQPVVYAVAPGGARLKPLEVPEFSGDPMDWEMYRDLFKSMVVNNPALTNTDKLHYLRNSLKGYSSQLLASIQPTEGNFERAWALVTKEFENLRIQVNTQLNQLHSLEKVKAESATELRALAQGTRNIIGNLTALGRPTMHWDDMLVFQTMLRLDKTTIKEWETLIATGDNPTTPPTLAKLLQFLDGKVRMLVMLETSHRPAPKNSPSNSAASAPSKAASSNKPKPQLSSSKVLHTTSENSKKSSGRPPPKCDLCAESHLLMLCQDFRNQTPTQRREFIKRSARCFNCFGKHAADQCPSTKRCLECNGKHHTMLHETFHCSSGNKTQIVPAAGNQSYPEQNTQQKPASNATCATTLSATTEIPVFLATVLVLATGPSGKRVLVRAIVDQCSQASFISESLSQFLQLNHKSVHHTATGVEGQPQAVSTKQVQFNIEPYFESNLKYDVSAYVVSKITSYAPPKKGSFSDWSYLDGLQLADPHFDEHRKVDILLSSVIHARIVQGQVLKGNPSEPIATQTTLGWLVSGPGVTNPNNETTSTSLLCCEDQPISKALAKFWEHEEVSQPLAHLTPDEVACENHFMATHTRNKKGQYVLRLPVRCDLSPSTTELGESYPAAARMLTQMEKKFKKDPGLQDSYINFMREYQYLDHMRPADVNAPLDSCYFLPHHGVLKKSGPNSKLRVVFNGSMPTKSGNSVNDILYTGQNLLPDLSSLLLRWRSYQFVFSTDIEKMFRCILIDERDQHLQSILWREDREQPIQIYRLNTVTYGMRPSPYMANRTLRQLAEDERRHFPLASEILERETYMDDVLSGAHTIEQVQAKQQELIEILKVGGFPLHKWAANDPELLSQLPKESLASQTAMALDDKTAISILGLSWSPQDDYFFYRLSIEPIPLPLTKRKILSKIAQFFDPLGYLSPILITSKIFMQDLWKQGLDWDSEVSTEFLKAWQKWYSSLPIITSFEIPRWNGFNPDAVIVELHGFCDASSKASAAVVYIRLIAPDLTCRTTLLTAKSKVAPVNSISIPKLELCGAVLLAHLIKRVQTTLPLPDRTTTHLWTDSYNVLYWLHGHPSRWKTFVANRCAEIQSLLPDVPWYHVGTNDNPADLPSRGVTPIELQTSSLWWQGPSWLSSSVEPWPEPDLFSPPAEILEARKHQDVSLFVAREIRAIWSLIDNFTDLTRLLHVTSYCLRFLKFQFQNCTQEIDVLQMIKNFPAETEEIASPDERDYALLFWVYLTQRAHFEFEIKALKSGESLRKSNYLKNLDPILVTQLLRVGGRLKHSLLPPDSRNPLILPPDSALTILLIRHTHNLVVHGGTQLTLSTLRQRFWIINGRTAVKSFIKKCVDCIRYSKTTNYQKMGNLPRARITIARPFSRSGVDYAGPFNIRTAPGRGHKSYKGYIALFVCFTTKAVHLEVVSSYNTPAFISAFRRFISRRGHCAELWSDQGPNFTCADKELRAMFKNRSDFSNKIGETLARFGTKWHFNPPAAPHFGGLWEAAVKSVKHHLKRVLGNSTLTFEEFYTLLCQIEACLNSRPLWPIQDDASDTSPLTPSHFLIGSPSYLLPEPRITGENLPPLQRWRLLSQQLQHFWDRWSREYLQQLQKRVKWQDERPQLQIGDIVLIRSENTPPGQWPLARIIELTLGDDNLPRVATLQIADKTLQRLCCKLVLLHRKPVSA